MKNVRRWMAGVLAVILILNSSWTGGVWAEENHVTVTGSGIATTNIGTGTGTNSVDIEENLTEKEESDNSDNSSDETLIPDNSVPSETQNTNVQESEEQKASEENTDNNTENSTEVETENTTETSVYAVQDNSAGNTDTGFLNDSTFIAMCQQVFGDNNIPTANDIVYVAGNSVTENTSDKGSYANPWGSLKEARAANTSAAHAVYYLLGDYTSSAETVARDPYTGVDVKDAWPEYSQPAIIVSQNDKAYLSIGNTWNITGNLGFYRTSIHTTKAENVKIYCNGHTVVFGGEGMDNFKVTDQNSYYPVLFGGGISKVESTNLIVNGGTWARIYGAGEGANGTVTGKATLCVNGKVTVNENGEVGSEPISGKCSVHIVSNQKLKSLYINTEDICPGAATTTSTRPSVGSTVSTIDYLNYGMEYSASGKYKISTNGGRQGEAALTIRNSTVSSVIRGFGSSSNLNCNLENVVSDIDMSYPGAAATIGGVGDGLQTGSNFTMTVSDCNLKNLYAPNGVYSSPECNVKLGKEILSVENTSITGILGGFKHTGLLWEDSELNLSGQNTDVKGDVYALKQVNLSNLSKIVDIGGKDTNNIRMKGYEAPISHKTHEILLANITVTLKESSTVAVSRDIHALNLSEVGTSANVYQDITIATVSGSGQVNLADDTTLTVQEVQNGSLLKAGPAGEITHSALIVGQFTSNNGVEFSMGTGCYNDQSPYFSSQPGTGTSIWMISATDVSELDETHIYVNQAAGNDENSGGKYSPVKTLAAAFGKITATKNTVVLQTKYLMEDNEQLPTLDESNKIQVTFTANDGVTNYKKNAVLIMPSSKKIGCDMTFKNIYINTTNRNVNLYTMSYQVLFAEGSSGNEVNGNSAVSIVAGAPADETVSKVSVTFDGWENSNTSNGLRFHCKVGNSHNTGYNQNKIAEIKIERITGQMTFEITPTIYGSCSIESKASGNHWLDMRATVYGDLLYDALGYNYYDSNINCYCAGKLTIAGTQKLGNTNMGIVSGTYGKGIDYEASASLHPVCFSNLKLGGDLIVNGAIDAPKLEFKNVQNISDTQTGNIIVNHCGTCKEIICDEASSDKLTVNAINTTQDVSGKTSYILDKVTGVGTWNQQENTEVEVKEEFQVRNCELKDQAILNISSGADNTFGNSENCESYTVKLDAGATLMLSKPLQLFGNLVGTSTSENAPCIDVNCDTVKVADENNCNRIAGRITGNIRLNTNSEYEDSLEKCQKIWMDQEVASSTDTTKVLLGNNTGTFWRYDENIKVSSLKNSSEKYEVYFGGPDRSVIYLNSETGNDSNMGISPEQPLKTMEMAYNKVSPGGTIVVENEITVSAWPSLVRTVHISSYDPKNQKFYSNGVLRLPKRLSMVSDIYLECLTVDGSSTAIYANGKKIVIGVTKTDLDNMVVDDDQENVHNLQGTIAKITGIDSAINSGAHIEINSGTIGTIYVVGDENYHPVFNQSAQYEYIMTGGNVTNLYGDLRTDPSSGSVSYVLSGGKVNLCKIGRESGYYNSSLQISVSVSGTFSFDNLYLTSTHAFGNRAFTISFDNWNTDGACTGNIYVGRRGITATCTDTISVTNSVIPCIIASSNATDTQTLCVDLNLKEGATIKELVAGNTENGFESIQTLNINLLGKDASIESLKNYGQGTQKTSQIKNIYINISNGVENTLDFLRDVRSDLDYRPVLNITNNSLAVLPDNLKINGKIAQVKEYNVDAGSGLYISKTTTLDADYRGAVNESDDPTDGSAYLYVNNGAILTVTGTITGNTQLRSATLKTGKISENKDGFPNGVNIYAALKGSLENGIVLYPGYECDQVKNALTTNEDSEKSVREWKIADSTNNEYRNSIYVDGSDGSNDAEGSYVRPVKTLAKAYEKAAAQYVSMYEQLKNSQNADTEVTKNLKDSLSKGITIHVEGSVALGDMSAPSMLSEIQRAENLTGLTDISPMSKVRIEGMENADSIQFDDKASELILPIETTFSNMTLKSECTSVSPVIYANGNTLNVESDVICSASRSGFGVYGGGKDNNVESANVYLYGGVWENVYGGSQSSTVNNVQLLLAENAKVNKVYGGGYEQSASVNNIRLTIDGAVCDQVCGGGFNAPSGDVTINMISGKVNSLYGSGEQSSAESKSGNVVIGGSDKGETAYVTAVYRGAGVRTGFKEGETAKTVLKAGCVFGSETSAIDFCGGGYSGTVSNTEIILDGGTVYGNIHAGGYGTKNSTDYGNVSGNTSITINGGTVCGNIFGGGNNGRVLGIATVTYNDGIIQENQAIYGSGDAADVNKSIVTINKKFAGDVYGGSFQITNEEKNHQSESEVILNESVNRTFGGSNLAGDINGSVKITIPEAKSIRASLYGGGNQAAITVQPSIIIDGALTGNIFGGGKGELKTTNKIARALLRVFTSSDLIDANVPSTNVVINGTVTGDVFGGGEYATVGNTDGKNSSEVVSSVTVNGTVNGTVYGGGKGEEGKDYAAINGSTQISLGEHGRVTVKGNAENSSTGVVFGGGQNAPVAGNTNVNMTAGTYSTVFGGNDISGEIQGETVITATGGQVEHVYGAGRDAAYNGTGASVTMKKADVSQNDADTNANSSGTNASATVSEVYGGGYGTGAATNKATVSIKDGEVTTAYAGGNAASIENAEISVTGGTVDTVFGGGNAATITGSSTINVNTTDNTKHVETIFAGNNQAAMAIKPTLKLQSGKIGTLYCGGNQGVMTYVSDNNKGIKYSFDYPAVEIETVYAGCNNTAQDTDTSNVELILVRGTYGTIYGGNNQNGTMAQTSVVVDASTDTLASNDNAKPLQVTTIYGGGNQANAKDTKVTVKNGQVTTIYGGGNQATVQNAVLSVEKGQIDTVYGGGNAATVTNSVNIKIGSNTGSNETDSNAASAQIAITNLYCGNNEAEMAIAPTIDLQKGTIANFYGGGNKGAMTCESGISYTFDSADLTVDTMYGGGNEAGVTTKTALLVKDGNYTTIYGGSNSKGTVQEAKVTIAGDVGKAGDTGTGSLSGKIFGGGRGQETTVHTAAIYLQNGIIAGNVYGGSGFGTVDQASVTAKESTKNITSSNTPSSAKVQVLGDVFGAGYGVSSSVSNTDVTIDLNLSITDNANADGDVQVTETAKSTEDMSGESLAKAEWKNGKKYTDGSYIAGNVFGGGDMGQVGKGYINSSTNTAVIEQGGTTSVTVSGGYIHGNVFGGGNGQPGGTDESGNAITEYTVYMGTVFGTSLVTMNGGYVNGSVFGCGQQSRTYAAEDRDGDGAKDASFVILATDGNAAVDEDMAADGKTQKPVLIGGSIFGGGNKGNGTVQNASVATTYGDTHVTLRGKEKQNTPIYLLSNANGTAGGGVYGDGNLCLVSGKKYVTLQNFSCGVGENVSLLKTFYSLQRADVVNLIGSRIVLKGAVDLVAENADDTLYSINRVSQLNLKKNSTIKVTKTVNLLGELTSDEQPDRQFIDRGNNTGNASITGNGYTASGGEPPTNPLTEIEVTNYISAYNAYAKNGTQNSTYQSINVVCVANGGYLEIKKSATEYGPVTGLFTLQLVNANPGEGGGFVYADIMGKKVTGSDGTEKYVTGNFVCVTKQEENSSDYMFAYHNVGGKVTDDGKYEYYVWYLKGNKYNYDVDLTAYIGTKDTDFTKNISLALEQNQVFILTELNQSKDVNGVDLNTMYQNTWDTSSDGDKASDKFAVEVTLMKNEKNSTGSAGLTSTETSIGYLGYQTESDTNPNANARKDSNGKLVWGIWRKTGTGTESESGVWKFQACKGSGNSFQVISGDALAEIGTDVVSAQLKFTLRKGTGMTTEFKNLPFEMKLVEVGKNTYEAALKKTDSSVGSVETDSCIRLNTNLNLSAIRLVPTQAAYIGSGRMFAGVSSSSTVNITETSAFTAQFVTKYIPSAFNTGTQSKITETLATGYNDMYLLDPNGVGYTIQEETDGRITIKNLTNTSNPEVKKYQITKKTDGVYQVSYFDSETAENAMIDTDGSPMVYDCTVVTKSSGFTLPKGTMITLLASLDENDPTYWYYYCTEGKTEIPLSEFKKMNTSNENSTNSDGTTKSSGSVYDTIFTTSSSRVTENMIFIFDFSKVSASDWENVSQTQPEGAVMLRHTYEGVVYRADIMDYVSTESQTSQDGSSSVKYTRETPKQTDVFRVSRDSDGIQAFTLTNTNDDENPTYGQKERMRFTMNITPDTTVTNTQYEEREYAVILTLKKKSGDSSGGTGADIPDIAFPEGTTFTYKGEKLPAGKDNKYVVVPVKTVGTHEVEIESTLYGFDSGEYELAAKLYSTTEDGYYNSILVTGTNGQDTAAFTIRQDPTYALQVKEMSAENNIREKNHFVTFGESMDFKVTAKSNDSADGAGENSNSVPVEISLYKYVTAENNTYKKIAMDTVLEGNLEENSKLQLTAFNTDTNTATNAEVTAIGTWEPVVRTSAAPGVYRLEFTWHDRTEYWDFKVLR